jgi:hypothetical protein
MEDQRPDPLLRESAAILSDALILLNGDRQLSQQVLPASAHAGALVGVRRLGSGGFPSGQSLTERHARIG